MIEIRSVSKKFSQGKKSVVALSDLSLCVKEGEICGIIGLSGAGKSTLIRMLAGLILPTQGEIFFNGISLASLKDQALAHFRQQMGMIFQHFNLFSARTVAENVSYPLEIANMPLEERGERVLEMLELVGLLHKKDVYPSALSGGEKQRAAIARALAPLPKILLCDEATSALDPRTKAEIFSLLKKLHKKLGLTIVLITHEMEMIRELCTKVAVIDGGRIVEQGDVLDLFMAPSQAMTKALLQGAPHTLPPELMANKGSNRKVVCLRFKGSGANEPLISQAVKKFDIEANILAGWIDRVQETTVGTLIVQWIGPSDKIEKALQDLKQKGVLWEEVLSGF